jgi:hypothetical protein
LGGQVDDIGSLPSRGLALTRAPSSVTEKDRDLQTDARRDQENDCPQPQLRSAFGLLIEKPAPCSASL